ncbi:hypothetical protein [Bowmanella denitrificans]|uniref:hypothetical protein n=1 Tax=Bowmanella denitrificans TaxID=366582 RepID=UPI000C9D1E2C|nr:hypothetical protein [Bowmanella denitrificans]
MKASWLAISLLISQPVLAAATVQSLDVSEDLVVFSLNEAKTSQVPACVADNLKDKWAIRLTNESDKAMYALLMTAMATKSSLSVVSANHCAVEGYESPGNIKILPSAPISAPKRKVLQTVAYGIRYFDDNPSYPYKYISGCQILKTLTNPSLNNRNYMSVQNRDCYCDAPATLVTGTSFRVEGHSVNVNMADRKETAQCVIEVEI